MISTINKPRQKRKSFDEIKYVPDFVLEQVFNNINKFSKTVIPVIWIMYKTGLRVSDTLQLKQNCLVTINGQFWIVADIEKTYVQNHKIPIDNQLANMLAVLINDAKNNSNKDNNPENYIFVRYTGARKGKPYTQKNVTFNLNIVAINNNIIDEYGNIYHFKNHAFRHTYAIKMLNNGVDIMTLQELLAHSSPEMTLRYAKLLDTTKRKTFDTAVKQGVFSFENDSSKLMENNNMEIPKEVIDMLWTNHKLKAVDTPYGTCLQRNNGKCTFSKQPPCLTCNGGNPCKDLCIGAFEGDIFKYEILIKSTKSLIKKAKDFNRIEMVKENQEILNLYNSIYEKITKGNIVYSRLDRLLMEGVNANG